jgi:tRNA pseudouridine38-40 synthase
MKKFRLLIEYDGAAYHGWQLQKDATTVQGIIEDRILKITGERSAIVGASRTDAGVHALGQVAVFRTGSGLDAETMKKALNANLPEDIRVLDAAAVDDSFHPRTDAIKKTYFYIVANQRNSSVFLHRYSWLVPQPLDLNAMTEASRTLIGRHDFSSFMGAGSDVKDFVREIYSLNLERLEAMDFLTASLKGNFVKISVEANGFLRHMVRNIVGTLVEVGRGRIPGDRMKEILESHDRRCAGQTAAAKGLVLRKIVYPGTSVDVP